MCLAANGVGAGVGVCMCVCGRRAWVFVRLHVPACSHVVFEQNTVTLAQVICFLFSMMQMWCWET